MVYDDLNLKMPPIPPNSLNWLPCWLSADIISTFVPIFSASSIIFSVISSCFTILSFELHFEHDWTSRRFLSIVFTVFSGQETHEYSTLTQSIESVKRRRSTFPFSN